MPAEIIVFPSRRTNPPPATAETSQERLRRALAQLDSARANQREAITGWRQALSDLQVSMRALDTRLTRYRDQLEQLQQGVAGVRGQAQRLERWAANAEPRDVSKPRG